MEGILAFFLSKFRNNANRNNVFFSIIVAICCWRRPQHMPNSLNFLHDLHRNIKRIVPVRKNGSHDHPTLSTWSKTEIEKVQHFFKETHTRAFKSMSTKQQKLSTPQSNSQKTSDFELQKMKKQNNFRTCLRLHIQFFTILILHKLLNGLKWGLFLCRLFSQMWYQSKGPSERPSNPQ